MDSGDIYGPLPSADSIRLLKLERTVHEGSLEISLSTISLSNPGVLFNALQTAKVHVSSFALAIGYKLNKRNFFVTERGYMGLGSPQIDKGDLVSVLPGCSVPIVLRKIDQWYVLRGECFVMGLMDGEAIDAFDEGKAVLEEFAIH
jgi:hypothetical protein